MIEIFYLDKSVKQGDINKLADVKDKPVWIDAFGLTAEEADLLKVNFDLHKLTVEDLLTAFTRVKVEEFHNYLFCVFYRIKEVKSIELEEMEFVVGRNFFISVHKEKIPSFEELKNNKEKLEKLFNKGPDFLMHKLLVEEVDNYFIVLGKVENHIDLVEDEAVKNPTPLVVSKILRLKRQINKIKKVVFYQREKIALLAKGDTPFISEKALPYFRDIHDHSIMVWDIVDNARDAVSNTFDVYMSTISTNMDKVIKALTVVATVTLPFMVISSIYGTNFANIPGSQHPFGFEIMILFMILLAIIMMYSLKKRKWI